MLAPFRSLTVAALLGAVGLWAAPFGLLAQSLEPFSPDGLGPKARVIAVRDPEATDAFEPRPERIKAMVDDAITNLTGKSTVAQAWQTVVSTNSSISSNDVIGIKVFSVPGPTCGTRPAVVAAVVQGLLAAGVPPRHIIVWDKQTTDLRLAGFYNLQERFGVRVEGSAQAGYDENVYYDSPILGNLIWGDLEFGKTGDSVGRKSFVTKLLTKQITKTINITPLLNHNLAGVSGNLYSLVSGSVDNFARFESDPGRLANAVPEIYAMTNLSDHVVLNIVDALICQYEGSERGLLHYSAILNELRFSKDPVALDVLSIQDLKRQRELGRVPPIKPNLDLYSNASLLELGVSDLKRIRVETLHLPAVAGGSDAAFWRPSP